MTNKVITDYWRKHYCAQHCTLCGNHGFIDARGVRTPAGLLVGRINYCVCPNGQALRKVNAALPSEVTVQTEMQVRQAIRNCK